MKCEAPGCQNEATVHEVVIKAGQKVERHLCEQHAQTEGVVAASHAPINELLTKFVMSQAGAQQPPEAPPACPTCGMTWSNFREKGLLGCPDCYETFEEQLTPLLSRAHEGGVHHTGKNPSRAGMSAGLHRELSALRRELDDAIKAEEYERAASIRDRIRELHGESGDADPAPAERAKRAKPSPQGGTKRARKIEPGGDES